MLRLCLRGLRQNGSLPHQVVAFVNEGRDGTADFLAAEAPEVDVVVAPRNVGICYALNLARRLARAEYLVYLNDDMFVLPGWDARLLAVADAMPRGRFMLSATMIEPYESGNACVSYGDYGHAVAEFREAELLARYREHARADWSGSTWPPNLLPTELWDAVGGLSVEFSPGIYSDPDLSMKCWAAGVREFRGVGDSLVYHFGRQSTRRLGRHRGQARFLGKWGMTASAFSKYYLRLGQPYAGPLPEVAPRLSTARRLKDGWRRVRASLGPLEADDARGGSE